MNQISHGLTNLINNTRTFSFDEMQSVHVFIFRLKTFPLSCLSKNDFRLGD